MFTLSNSSWLWIAGVLALAAAAVFEFKHRRTPKTADCDWPAWFTSLMKRRFDLLVEELRRQPEAVKRRAEINAVEERWKSLMDETNRAYFLQWEEMASRYEAVEKERLYLQGLRDGMNLARTRPPMD